MKKRFSSPSVLSVLSVLSVVSLLLSPLAAQERLLPRDPSRLSIRHEVRHAIDIGLEWLRARRDGVDSLPFTALALQAFMADPDERDSAWVKKGFAYLESRAHANGGIYGTRDAAEYETSLCEMALLAANDPKYGTLLRKARGFLSRRSEIMPKRFPHHLDARRAYDMARTLITRRVDRLDDGADWESELAKRMMNLQDADGSWSDDRMQTAYGVATLAMLYRSF